MKIERFRDVSCGGAETRHVTEPHVTLADTTVRPQLDAVRPGTELVTVGIGGNDFGVFGQGLLDVGDVPADSTQRIGERLVRVLRLITRRAPSATVVLVGYPRIVEAGASCPELPFPSSKLGIAVELQESLNQAMRKAASEAGALFVDLFPASRGHGICSRRPWVNGRENVPGEALAYHPFAVEMRAVAREVELALDAHGSMHG